MTYILPETPSLYKEWVYSAKSLGALQNHTEFIGSTRESYAYAGGRQHNRPLVEGAGLFERVQLELWPSGVRS